MADIIDFTARKQAKAAAAPPTITELNVESVDFLLADWERMVKTNRLNDYFKRALPQVIGSDSEVNFMSDLNEISKVEIKLDIAPMIFFPGTTQGNKYGWVVQYKLGDGAICTPEMAAETYARCFGILLYLKVKHAARECGAL